MPRRIVRAAAALLLLLPLNGCGGGERLYPVQGVVQFPDGTPLTGGRVMFQPAAGVVAPSVDGDIDDNGRFTLRTHEPGDGVAPGKYQAIVVPRSPGGERPKLPIDVKFTQYASSGLEFEVKPEANEFAITVTPPKK